MKGVIYTRVSSDEQVKGTSLDSQEEVCRAYCREKGIEVLAVFREEGASAKSADRAEFLRAIEYCRQQGDVSAFVVAKVDRFARNTEDHFYIRKILLDFGTTLHSVSEPIGNNPVEKLMETILAGAAEFDNSVRRMRCVDGMAKKLRQGIYPWHPPIGYVTANNKMRGEKKNEPDAPHPEIFPIIQRALQEYSRGLCTKAELVRLVDEWGLAAIRGKKTRQQLIDNILGRYLKFYAGILVSPWKEEEYVGRHRAMITHEEYIQIVAVKSGKVHHAQRFNFNPTFPLRKTVKCGECGRPLTGSASKGRHAHYAYYHCYNKECAAYGKGVPKDELEKKFKDELLRLAPTAKFFDLLRANILDIWSEQSASLAREHDKRQRDLLALEAKRKMIFEMREDGSYTQEEFQERKGAIENEIAAVRISLNEIKLDELDIEGAISYAKQFCADLGRQWSDLSPKVRPRFQKLVWPEGISFTREKGFGTAKLGVIFELAQINQLNHAEPLKIKTPPVSEWCLEVVPGGIEPPFSG